MTSRDDEQAGRVADLAQQLEAFEAHALEAVGRAARLEGAAAQELARRRPRRCFALVRICSRDSTEQGPAMTTTSLPPTTTPLGKVTMVPSGRKLRPASL